MGKIGLFVLCAIATSLVISQPQFGSFVSNQYSQVNHPNYNFNQADRYQNNPFLSYRPGVDNQDVYHQTPQEIPDQLASTACDGYWTYQSNYNGPYGLITIPNPDYIKTVLRVTLTIAAQLSPKNVGDISLAKDRSSAASDIANGLPLTYRVEFPLQNPIPQVTAIYNNDQLLCTGPKAVGQVVTTINFSHTFSTGLMQPQPTLSYYQPSQRPDVVQHPSWIPHQTTRRPVAQPPPPVETIELSPNDNRFGDFDFDCGISDYKSPTSTGLIIGGQRANRGQFPWLAAYFHNGPGENGFICGGSLISTKLVLTAAHCIHNKNDTNVKKAEDASFYLGKHNLETLVGEKNYVNSAVTQFIIHPDWDFTDDHYDADLAIAVLFRSVPFTKFVKPICLWTASTSYADLIGQDGIVAGWGKTEFDAISTNQPMWTEIPVVSEATCLRSNYAFIAITSDRTFCAGNRIGGTGPCLGDSGGGFITKSAGKWFLRGIVSAALIDKALATCDTRNYAVFTDTSRFTNWIQGYIQRHG